MSKNDMPLITVKKLTRTTRKEANPTIPAHRKYTLHLQGALVIHNILIISLDVSAPIHKAIMVTRH